MKIQFIFLFLVFSTVLSAQKIHKITLSSKAINLPNRQFHIETVIDHRMNKETIGFIQKGLGNKRINAKFSETLPIHLLKTFSRLIPVKTNTTIPIIAKVHNLYISERTTAWKEFGKAEITIEFLTADTSRSWGKFFAEVEQNGMDVTKKHDERILLALETCLKKLVESWDNPPSVSANLENFSFDPSKSMKEGFYPTFSSFVKQEPLTDAAYTIKFNKKNQNWVEVYRQSDGKRVKKDLFGFCDGQNFYLSAIQYSYQPHFVKAHFTGTYFYFEDKISNTGATIAFGLIGALASNKTKGILLDTRTGLVSELNRDFLVVAVKGYPDLKKWYNKTKKGLAEKKELLRKLNEAIQKESQKG